LASTKQLKYQYAKGTIGGGNTSITFDEPVSSKNFTSRGRDTEAVMREYMVVHEDVK